MRRVGGGGVAPLLGILLLVAVVLGVDMPSGTGTSMLPTIPDRAGAMVFKGAFGWGRDTYVLGWHPLALLGGVVIGKRQPRRGEVVSFACDWPACENKHDFYSKRIVGLPGDRIEVRKNALTINGVAVRHAFARAVTIPVYENESAQPRILDHLEEGSECEERLPGEAGAHRIYVWRRSIRLAFPRPVDAIEVKPGHYFVLGDNRDISIDSRDYGQVPESKIIGKIIFNRDGWLDWQRIDAAPPVAADAPSC